MNNRFFALFISTTFLSPFTTNAVEFELKQKIKTRSSVVVSEVEKDDVGNTIELKDKLKNRKVYQARFVVKFDEILGGFSPYAQLGYEKERKIVDQKVTTNNTVANESYNEYITSEFVGVGLKYKFKDVLFADKIKFDFRFDRWLNIDVERSKLAPQAEPLAGDFTGYERKVKMEAEYSTSFEQLKIQPHIYYAFFKQNSWYNSHDTSDLQVKEKGHEVEARLLATWLPESIENLTLSLGPEIIVEHASEYETGFGWVSENDDVTLLTFLGTYELEKHGLEFELWFNHQLDGEVEGENNLEFKVDWNF